MTLGLLIFWKRICKSYC